MSEQGALAAFYNDLDTGLASADGRAALMGALTGDFRWEISLPDKILSGDRDDFAAFLESRAKAAGSHSGGHRVVMSTGEGQREVVMGYLEAEGAAPSPFVAAASIDGSGLISRLMLRRSKLDL